MAAYSPYLTGNHGFYRSHPQMAALFSLVNYYNLPIVTAMAIIINTYKVGPPNDSAQLVQITPITMVYDTQITLVFMFLFYQFITRGPTL